jgi:hypothetical protein
VPNESYTVSLGEAAVRRSGTDVSVYTWGAMTRPTMEAAEELAEEGIDCEVIDLRTLSPLDEETITTSFEKTGRGVVVHEAPRTGGLGGEIVATIQEDALLYQEAPIGRVTGFDVPFPLYAVEDYYLPEAARIKDGIRETVEFCRWYSSTNYRTLAKALQREKSSPGRSNLANTSRKSRCSQKSRRTKPSWIFPHQYQERSMNATSRKATPCPSGAWS